MKKEYNRCERIAKLLLIENEVIKLEKTSSFVSISDVYGFPVVLSPIEEIMAAILLRIHDRINEDFNFDFELKVYPQKKIGKYTVDFFISMKSDSYSKSTKENKNIIIECDGHDFHEKTKDQAKHDKERDRFFTSNGIKVLRYTGSEIYNDFEKIEDELSEILSPESELWK